MELSEKMAKDITSAWFRWNWKWGPIRRRRSRTWRGCWMNRSVKRHRLPVRKWSRFTLFQKNENIYSIQLVFRTWNRNKNIWLFIKTFQFFGWVIDNFTWNGGLQLNDLRKCSWSINYVMFGTSPGHKCVLQLVRLWNGVWTLTWKVNIWRNVGFVNYEPINMRYVSDREVFSASETIHGIQKMLMDDY